MAARPVETPMVTPIPSPAPPPPSRERILLRLAMGHPEALRNGHRGKLGQRLGLATRAASSGAGRQKEVTAEGSFGKVMQAAVPGRRGQARGRQTEGARRPQVVLVLAPTSSAFLPPVTEKLARGVPRPITSRDWTAIRAAQCGQQYFGKTGLSLDDWASVTRASHTPTCERRRTGPPLAARLGRAPPSVAAAAASARDAARTREVQARHGAAGTWRGGGNSYVTFALRGAVVHCSGNAGTRVPQPLCRH
ncbi:hypothetical protein E2C01_040182 [Portunus trituberculatus]|uniref:Uncharacterized protein n=1 Tax=Portunus trituberculatus TaxID=210409 RepID=A0A5B7FGQ0_PORTR|nr:hypothetical protein [Portunus trituberculatus]